MRTKSVSDLVTAVDRRLKREGASPGRKALTRLFEIVYFTSLKTEEGRPVQVRLALVDPSNPDPDRPPHPRPDRWKIMKLAHPITLTVSNLVKLSKAADPWSSCLAVYYDSSGEPFIWGLVDQVVHFNTYLVHEKPHAYAPPGVFQLIALGTADLSVYREHEFIARLAQDTLSQKQSDVFWAGPISDRLDKGISPYITAVWDQILRREKASYVREKVQELRNSDDWDSSIAETWIGTICRILISIQRYRHGGALLVANSKADLAIKYRINYPRLRMALARLWAARLREWIAEAELEPVLDDPEEDLMPIGLYLDRVVASDEKDDFEDEVTGCVRFISSLSCVDGLILATPDLVIRGFGVEIRTKKEIDTVYLVPGPKVHSSSLKKVDPNHYGTRHRSMMRYCFAHPASFGFVISQDGDIRVMTRVQGKLVMWENLKVLDFIQSYKSLPKPSSTKKGKKKQTTDAPSPPPPAA